MPKFSKSNLLLASFLFLANCNAGDEIFIERVPLRIDETNALQLAREADEMGAPFKFARGDFEGVFTGKLKTDYVFYDDAVYLNNKIPDQFGLFKSNIDLVFNLIYGKKKYGHKAFEALFDLNSKVKWGVLNGYKNSSPAEIKLGSLSLGSHDHRSTRAVPWFSNAWMKFSFNSIFNSDYENLHFFKIGWFPFKLGRGIAFGPYYGSVYEDLGLFSYSTDSYAPGMYIKGTLIKDILSYYLYYAKFEDKSTTLSDTYNDAKKNHVGRWKNPWMGVAQDDDLWAARLKIKPIKNRETVGDLRIEPYVFYNTASAQKVWFKNDSKTNLGSYGLAVEYYLGNFEIGGETAFNFGEEKLYAVDRNQLKSSVNNTTASLYEYYDKLTITDPNFSNRVVVWSGSQDLVKNYTESTNGASIGTLPAGGPQTGVVYNAQATAAQPVWNNRFRQAYKNKLRGWMATIDTLYNLKKWNLKFAASYAYASGDGNPHTVESNKTYHGFIGLHELYQGKRVESKFVLGERTIKQPVSIRNNEATDDVSSNTMFTDLHVLGFGTTWTPKKLKLNPNLLFYWKAKSSLKYDSSTGNPISDTKASKFKGTELNLISSYELLKNLTLEGIFAIFFPGSYYKDIKGAKFADDYYDKYISGNIPASAAGTVNPADYRISDHTAGFMDISLTYKF
ncbi:hypothetical protein K9L05_01625 [Candidatus Babeliales bacterium]|nr:hypothetical protein [Candidatus Babeliales bacterium]MCF7899331.1 hypothetical protein [Candidatus Babeliales bacterium]